jgi:hypothetical protein
VLDWVCASMIAQAGFDLEIRETAGEPADTVDRNVFSSPTRIGEYERN